MWLAAPLLAVFTLAVLAAPASAHDPIFLTEDQDSPETGPYLPDGTISFAVYGSLLAAGDTRGLEFDLRDGDDLYLSLLIPDLEPEINLAEAELPTMSLTQPDGSVRAIAPDTRSPFADPFSGTNYVTLFETVETGQGGRHQLVVSGDSPTRFVVAVGTREEFFTPTERSGDKPTSFPAIAEPLNVWYTTPADGSVSADTGDAEDVDIDVELVEEELAKLADAEADADAGDASESEDEIAAGPVDGDEPEGGSSATWVAPIAVLVAAIGGALFYFRRRQTA